MSVLLAEKQGPVTILTMNRPERHNALSAEMSQALSGAVVEFREDPEQRVLIITGAGDKAFCSGADLKAMRETQKSEAGEAPPSGNYSPRLPMARAPDMAGLAACEKPVIAAINGLAVGGGLEIALCCDIRVAADDAWFQLPEPGHGFLAGVAAVALPRLLPFGVAMDMMLAQERLHAPDAYRLGLVQAVTSRDNLIAEAMRRAQTMAKSSPSALWGTKQVLRYWRDLQLQEHHRYYEAVVHRVLLSGDMIEGIRAFAEKRDKTFRAGWPDPFERARALSGAAED